MLPATGERPPRLPRLDRLLILSAFEVQPSTVRTMNTMTGSNHASLNTAAQLWLSTRSGWRVRADQVVALRAGRNHSYNSDEPRFEITARVAYDPEVTYTLAQFDDEDLTRRSLHRLLERMADWNKGFGIASIGRLNGGVSIRTPGPRTGTGEEDDASAS